MKIFSCCFIFLLVAAGVACAQTAPAPAAPAVQGEPLELTTQDGWKISAVYRPADTDKNTVIFVHSLGRTKDDWAQLSEKVSQSGFGYVALDLRGHGASVYTVSGSSSTFKSFSKTGTDNEFNLMTRDIETAIDYLKTKNVPENKIAILGSGLGANLAIKTTAMHSSIAMSGALTPSLNANRDVLAVNPLRSYGKRPILIVTSVDNLRLYSEVAILYAIARITAGTENAAYITEPEGTNNELLTDGVTRRIIQWLKTPARPAAIAQPAKSEIEILPEESDSSQTDAQ